MAFWGIEVKPGKPYVHCSDDERGRLHVSQATLGSGASDKKSIVQCKVGDKKPIYLCSLLPEKLETCALNLEFEEDDEVVFSIIGPHSVHLSGFFYGDDEDQDNMGDDYGSDPYEGDIVMTDSEDEDDSVDYDSEDEEEDEYMDDEFGMFPSSPVHNSGVRIEEIMDEDKPTDENSKSKGAKKKKSQSNTSDGDGNSDHQIVVKAGSSVPILESEDEDGFPIPTHEKKSDISKSERKLEETNSEKNGAKTQKKNEKDDLGKNLKRKIDAVGKDGKPERGNNKICGSSLRILSIPETEVKQEKKNKKKRVGEKVESAQENMKPNSNGTDVSPGSELGNDVAPSSEKKKEKKKKKKNKQQESEPTPNAEEKQTDKKTPASEKKEKESKSSQVRTFPNGLVIEELVMGKPAGKRASPGKKVSVHYIGKLKKNSKIFDSNVGRSPFKFRLGIGQVIKGWDVGVNGMRIGDKRRLTIPPAMGYGAKGAGPAIPPNSWLVFDVELVDVN